MKITLLNAKQVGVQLSRLMGESKNFYWAVAWATESKIADLLLANNKKIKQLMIGTDFAQTSPHLLKKLKNTKNVHVNLGKGGSTFHPKAYCFVDGEEISAIVGSSNFTNGGTNRNEEASLLIEGTTSDKSLRDILRSIDSWWKEGAQIEDDFLKAYELRWKANRKHRNAISKPIKIYRPTSKAMHPDLLGMSWSNYVRIMKGMNKAEIKKRLGVLQQARQLFNSVTAFSSLDLLERRAIAGVIGKSQMLNSDLNVHNWGMFGSMKGAGFFQNRINANDKNLSTALDCIPSIGDVSEEDYNRFCRKFNLAFTNTNKGGVPTASRLLAMKRPDYFVCIDKKNASNLGADVGFAPTTLKLENYWEHVVAPIIQASWWNSERPSGLDGKIWDGRAAMLDVVYMNRSKT